MTISLQGLRRLITGASAAAVTGLLAACSSPHAALSPSRAPAIRQVPASAALTYRLVVQRTHVVAGTQIAGTLVVVYHGRKPVNLNRGCRPQYAVALANRKYRPDVAFPADCPAAPFIIKPGVNRLAVTVQTTYLACTQTAGQATRDLPACPRGHHLMPPLPPGRYHAVLVSTGLPAAHPRPVPVTLSSHAPAR